MKPVYDGDENLGEDGQRYSALYLRGILDVVGAATARSTLAVTGATTLASTLAVTGASTLSGALGLSAVNLTQSSAQGATCVLGVSEELLTLSTSGTTTDTSASLLPADSIILAVCGRVTTTITTATDWKLGDGTTAGRFTAADSTMTAGETEVGLVHMFGNVSTTAAGPSQAAAAKVRVTTTGTPGAGAIRITVFYLKFTAATA